jgi:hypothetical protein
MQLKIKRARLSKSPFEAGQRQGARESHRKAGMDTGSRQRQPSLFTKPGRRERIVIPIHGNQPLKIGLRRALMKIAELSDEEI